MSPFPILFTHDELIFESAREAIKNVDQEIQDLNRKERRMKERQLDDYWKTSLNEKTKFARLFPSSERENLPGEMKDGNKYWDLLYEFEI